MKKKNLCKLLLAGIVSGCLMTTGIAFAEENTDAPVYSVQVFANGELMPYSVYFNVGELKVYPSNGAMAVNVKTKASMTVDHIYHDITIYKNGVWQSSDRYENWGNSQLNSYITVSAQSGDYIDVYVDHYTDHNGYVESAHSSKARYFNELI